MAVMDEFQKERESIKNRSFADKADYYWTYYKARILITLFAILIVSMLIHDFVTKKDSAFLAVLINSAATSEEQIAAFGEGFTTYAEINTEKYESVIDNSIIFNDNLTYETMTSSSQKLMTYTANGKLDVIVGDSEIFPKEANQAIFYDLRKLLSEEQIAKYEPYFYYMDQAYLDALLEAEQNNEVPVLPDPLDPTKPEEMENPVPVGIFVTDCSILTDAYQFTGDYIALGVMINAPHPETAIQFIDFLFDESSNPL